MAQVKVQSSKKALYLLLCGVLGMILFVIIQQAAILLLILLLINQLGGEAGAAQFQMFDSLTYVLAMFFGAWYGVWLGLHWYEIVYEQGRRGLFHAFLGRLANGNKLATSPVEKTPIIARPQPSPKPPATQPQVAAKPVSSTWRFEDLARLRPVTPRPDRVEPAVLDAEWIKKVAVKPSYRRQDKKVANAKPATKSATTRRKVLDKTITSPS